MHIWTVELHAALAFWTKVMHHAGAPDTQGTNPRQRSLFQAPQLSPQEIHNWGGWSLAPLLLTNHDIHNITNVNNNDYIDTIHDMNNINNINILVLLMLFNRFAHSAGSIHLEAVLCILDGQRHLLSLTEATQSNELMLS